LRIASLRAFFEMRVVGGRCKGRRLVPVKGLSTRPTSDKVREAVFDILQSRSPCERALDLFAGTGAMGIEALSRGASGAVFVDSDNAAVGVIYKNLASCGLENCSRVMKRDVKSALRSLARSGDRFDLIFVDPPYASTLSAEALKEIDSLHLLAPGGTVVVECSRRGPLPPDELEGIRLADERGYGDTIVRFYEEKDGPSE